MNKKKLPRRPIAGSRVPTSAPRRIAGRSARSEDAEQSRTEDETETSELDEDEAATAQRFRLPGVPLDKVKERFGGSSRNEAETAADGPDATEGVEPHGVLGRRGTTKVLGALAGLLTLVIIAMLAWTGWQAWNDDDGPEHVMAFDREYAVKEKPVRIPVSGWNAANNAASKAITEIFTFDWKNYDENVQDARALITEKFEKEYSKTATATREKFLASKADYEVTVVGQSVVEATPDEVATLIFLNQFVYKGEGDQRTGPEIYQARMLVRMVRTDRGWLVDELRTD